MLSMDEMMAQLKELKWLEGVVTISKNSPWPDELVKRVAEHLGYERVLVDLRVWSEEDDIPHYSDHLVFDVIVDIGDECVGAWGAITLGEAERNKDKLEYFVDMRLQDTKLGAIDFANEHGLFNKGKPNGT